MRARTAAPSGWSLSLQIRRPEKKESLMAIKQGDKMPAGKFRTMTASGPAEVTADELFSGKKVVLFSVPGAFTPTCSNQHLPSYLKNYDKIRAQGIDTIACMAVNDAFVMDAWGKDRGVGEKIKMLADGNGEYTKALGLELDASKFGLGTRGKRFSMIVENGVVKELNVDEGKYELTSAEHTCHLN
jgi:peroxiredoxin